MRDVYHLLYETGIVQFGSFGDAPVRLNFTLLPSYPDVMMALIDLVVDRIGPVDHLVSTLDALPLASGISLRTGIPLVYSRGSEVAPVHDLIGAYDIGHPAMLIDLVINNHESLMKIANRAGSVGLEINRCLCLVDLSSGSDTMQISPLLDLAQMTGYLADQLLLPVRHGVVLDHWIAAQRGH